MPKESEKQPIQKTQAEADLEICRALHPTAGRLIGAISSMGFMIDSRSERETSQIEKLTPEDQHGKDEDA